MENKEELDIVYGQIMRSASGSDRPVSADEAKELLKSFSDLADKQGYMRGVEEALRIVKDLEKPKSYWSHPWWREDEIAHNNAISQAHDAISKLKEIWS